MDSDDEERIINDGNYHLDVRASLITGAGRGVFAKERIPPHVIIGYYTGVFRGPYDKSNHPAYMFILNDRFYIDGYTTPMNIMALLNDAYRSRFENNCEFQLNYNEAQLAPNGLHERLVGIRTLRWIEPGEELYVSYGEDYWPKK